MTGGPAAAPGARRAWGWVAHLRDGGITGWRDWAGEAEPGGTTIPGAQQLELLRRINAGGRPAPALVDRVLTIEPPRRSRRGMPLDGGPPVPDHGPQPIDPAAVTDNELVRLAAVLLAEQLTAYPLGKERSWRLPRRVRHRLVGDPEYVLPLRRHLTGGARPAGSAVDRVLVVGTDTGRMLTDLWTSQCFRNGAVPWRRWIDVRAGRGGLPAAIDLDRIVQAQAAQAGVPRVHAVTDPTLLPGLLGVRRPPVLPPPPAAASAVDLGRRIAALLRARAVGDRRERLLTGVLRPLLADAPGLPLTVPEAHRAWVAEAAERLRHQLSLGRYRVHGDPALLLPVDRAGVEAPDAAETLSLAIRLLLAGTLGAASTKEEV